MSKPRPEARPPAQGSAGAALGDTEERSLGHAMRHGDPSIVGAVVGAADERVGGSGTRDTDGRNLAAVTADAERRDFGAVAARLNQVATDEAASEGGAGPWWPLVAVSALAAIGLAMALWQRERQIAPPEANPPAARFVVFADVDGWYRQTPAEVALSSRLDWSFDALPDALPMALGSWIGGERAPDPAVDAWFRDPPVSVERTYRRGDGELVWLSAFGHRGRRSYHLFEHTPDTCYPLGGWAIEHFAPQRMTLGDGPRPLTVNHGIAQREDGQQLVFVYFYLWDAPGRDPEDGVLSLRLAAPVRTSPAATLALLEREFLPELFATTLPWRRF
jgi:hypothetical protein